MEYIFVPFFMILWMILVITFIPRIEETAKARIIEATDEFLSSINIKNLLHI